MNCGTQTKTPTGFRYNSQVQIPSKHSRVMVLQGAVPYSHTQIYGTVQYIRNRQSSVARDSEFQGIQGNDNVETMPVCTTSARHIEEGRGRGRGIGMGMGRGKEGQFQPFLYSTIL